MLVCGHCKRSVAASFSECPFCNATLAGAQEQSSRPKGASSPKAAPPPAEKAEEAPPTLAASPTASDAAAAPAFELDFTPLESPARGDAPEPIELGPSGDFGPSLGESPGAPPLGDVLLDTHPSAQARPSADAQLAPSPPDFLLGEAPPAATSSGLLLGDEPLHRVSSDPMAAGAAPPADLPPAPSADPHEPPPSLGPPGAWRAPAPPRDIIPAGVSLPAPKRPTSAPGRGGARRHPLTWSGIVILVLAVFPLGFGIAVTGADHEVGVRALGALSTSQAVRVVKGFPAMGERLELDPSHATPLKSPYDLVSSKQLTGQTVDVVAEPIARTVVQRSRVGADGQPDPSRTMASVFAPLTLDRRVWVVSGPMTAKNVSDAPVVAFVSRRTYRGVVQPLKATVDLAALRAAEDEGPEREALARAREIPDDALAIVAYQETARLIAAPVAGTDRRVWAVTRAEDLADRELFGDYFACPDPKCEALDSLAPNPPTGVLVLRENVTGALASTVARAGVLLLLVGLALAGAGWQRERAARK